MWGDEITRAVACCGIVVLVAEPLIIPLLRRLAAVDAPGLRSSHTILTPRGGDLPLAVLAVYLGSPALLGHPGQNRHVRRGLLPDAHSRHRLKRELQRERG